MENKFEVGQKVRYMNEDYPLLNGRIFEVENYMYNGIAKTTEYKLKYIGHTVDENKLYHIGDAKAFKVGDRVKIKDKGAIYSLYNLMAKDMGIGNLSPALELNDTHGVIIDIRKHKSHSNKICVGVNTDDNKYFIIEHNGLEKLDTKLYVEPIDKSDFNLLQNNTMENLKDLRFENFANKNKKKIISISEELIEKQKIFSEMKCFFIDLECDIASLGSKLDNGYAQRNKEYITDVLKEAEDKLAELNTKEYVELVKLFNYLK